MQISSVHGKEVKLSSDIVEAINSRYLFKTAGETKLIRMSRYTGYVLGPLASVVVAPYAYQFGERVADNLNLGQEGRKALGGLFATCGTIGVTAVASLVCSNEFPAIVSFFADKTLTKIKGKLSSATKIGVAADIALSIISNIPGTYLTDQAYRNSIGNGAIIFDTANLLVWSTVSGWALYSIPTRAYRALVTRYPALSFSQTYTNRLKLIANIESVYSTASQLNEHAIEQMESKLYEDLNVNEGRINEQWLYNLLDSSILTTPEIKRKAVIPGKELVESLGIVTGFAANYFFIPTGRESGKLLAEILKWEQVKDGFAYIIGPTSFAVEGLMTALSARKAFINSYESLYINLKSFCKPRINNNRNSFLESIPLEQKLPENDLEPQEQKTTESAQRKTSIKVLILMLVVAFFSSSHRSELTAQYAPYNAFGKFLIGLSMFGLFCMNYWGINGLKEQFFSTPATRNKEELLGKLNATKDVIEAMDDKYVDHLTSEIS